jgi:hypothetical protein
LCDAFGGAQTVQTRHQTVVQRSGNSQDRQGIRLSLLLLQTHRLHDRFGHLLDEERYTVRVLDDLVHDVGRQGFAAGHVLDHPGTVRAH